MNKAKNMFKFFLRDYVIYSALEDRLYVVPFYEVLIFYPGIESIINLGQL